MSLAHVLLGLLGRGPASGWDLGARLAEDPALGWSLHTELAWLDAEAAVLLAGRTLVKNK